MENNVNYKPANRVRITKTIVIIFGVLILIAASVMAVQDLDGWAAVVAMGIGCFLLGGVLEGFAEIVDAACNYNWEFEQKHSQPTCDPINESEIQ